MSEPASTPDVTSDLIRSLLIGLDGIARDVDTYEYGLPIYGEESYERLEGEVRKFVEAVSGETRTRLAALESAASTSVWSGDTTIVLRELEVLSKWKEVRGENR